MLQDKLHVQFSVTRFFRTQDAQILVHADLFTSAMVSN